MKHLPTKDLRRHYCEITEDDLACVKWAEEILLEFPNSAPLLELASMTPPFDSYQVWKNLVSAVAELNLSPPDPTNEVYDYITEQLESLMAEDGDLLDLAESELFLFHTAQLYIDYEEPPRIKPFVDFYHAYDRLTTIGNQSEIPDLTVDNASSKFEAIVKTWFGN
jgi:hypothetical protein